MVVNLHLKAVAFNITEGAVVRNYILQRLPITIDLSPSKESELRCVLVDVNQRIAVDISDFKATEPRN